MPRVRSALVALAALAPLACQEPHPGEVEIHKVALQEPFLKSDRLGNTFLLRDRGFTLSDNLGRIRDVFGEHEHTGPLRLLRVLEEMDRECGSAEAKFVGDGRAADPKHRELAALHEEIHGFIDTLKARLSVSYEQKSPSLTVTPLARLEQQLEKLVEVLVGMSLYLQYLHDAIRQVRYDAAMGRREQIRFDLIFEIGSRPLDPRDWISCPPDHGGIALTLLPPNKFDPHFEERVMRPLLELLEFHRSHLAGRILVLQLREQELRERVASLSELLRRTTENALNLSKAVRHGRPEALRRKEYDGCETPAVKKGDAAIEANPHARVEADSMPFPPFIDSMGLDIEKLQHIIVGTLLLLREPMRQLSSNFTDELARFERIARTFARLTSRNVNKPLQRGTETEPVFLTLMLKTLFVKYMEESGQSELVVTAAVKHEQNATAAAYPLIFEENFRPGSFVNRKDRIMWGPAPYTGQFLDLRLTIIELDDLDNQSIVNGFANMTAAVSKFSPELSALSPALTAFVGAIVKVASKNDIELDASFTFPAPEGPDKADVDFLMTETGHYVILKREGVNRQNPEGIPNRSQEEMLYRRLIYNPDDGKLYWRRYFSSPRSNFTPDNLFRDQTYAVIVVSDEYTSADGLGEMLQQQVAAALGKARSQEYVPDLAHAAQMLKDLREFRREERKFERRKPTLTPEEREARSKAIEERKDLLWGEASSLRKQMIIDALYEDADPETRAALGTDLRKWKEALLYVAPNGDIRVVTKAVPPTVHQLALRPGQDSKVKLFDGRDPLIQWQFEVVGLDGAPTSPDDAGSIDKSGEYTAPRMPGFPRVRLRAVAPGVTALVRELEFTAGYALLLKAPKAEPVRVRAVPVSHRVLVPKDDKETWEVTGIPKGEKLVWWCNEKSLDTVNSFVTTSGSFVQSVKLEKPVDKDESRETIVVTLKRDAFDGEAATVNLLGVPQTFSKIAKLGAGESFPRVDLTLVYRHPLTFDAPRVVVTINRQGEVSRVYPPHMKAKLDPEYGAVASVTWTVQPKDGKVTDAGSDPGGLTPAKEWFDTLKMRPGSGTLHVKGAVVRKTDNSSDELRRAVEYLVIQE